MKAFIILLITIYFLIVTSHYLYVKYFSMPLLKNEYLKAKTHYSKILDDLKLLNEKPIFLENKSEKNAEDFLSKHISWQSSTDSLLASNGYKKVIVLLDKYKNWRSINGEFEGLYNDSNLMSIDTSWIEELSDYDHWDISTYPLIKNGIYYASNLSAMERVGLYSGFPLPNFLELRNWLVIYIMQKQHQGKGQFGIQMYRRVADLIHSTGTLVGNMSAVIMLKNEHIFKRNFKLHNWNLVTMEVIEAYKKVSWGWIAIELTSWFQKFPQEFEIYMKPELGLCASAWENMSGLTFAQDFLKSNFLFEKDFSLHLEQSKMIRSKLFSICNRRSFNGFLAPTPDGLNPLFINKDYFDYIAVEKSKEDESFYRVNISRLPYIRQIVGLNFITIAFPSYLGPYKEE